MKAGKNQSWERRNSAVAYAEHSLTTHNPLFFVHKFRLNKLMRCFSWPVSSK